MADRRNLANIHALFRICETKAQQIIIFLTTMWVIGESDYYDLSTYASSQRVHYPFHDPTSLSRPFFQSLGSI